MTEKTPLYACHLAAHAKMVPFHGWEMPLHYGSQIDEHHAVRKHAGIFDVSHMTVLDILGPGGRAFLRKLLTSDIDKIPHMGRALYTCLCNELGGILDDLIVYQRSPDNYRLILNSATRNTDLAWIQSKAYGFSVNLHERPELAMIAIQGPEALNIALKVLSPAEADAVSTLNFFECVDVERRFFARTGYTGEDGLEIIVPKEEAKTLWDSLIEGGAKPCGLGARDTLRLEAGLMLYGQDMDTSTTPLESGLSFTIHWEPLERDFIGMGALLSQKREGVPRKMVGLVLDEGGILRAGQSVIIPGLPNGVITSGTWSPTLQKSIALARVPAATGTVASCEIRSKILPVRVVKPRFVKQGTVLI